MSTEIVCFPRIVAAAAITAVLTLTTSAYAAQDADDFMNDFPPAPEARVTNERWSSGPQSRWTYQHIRELMPTVEIYRGDGPVYPLPESPKPIQAISVENLDGDTVTIADWLEDSYTDGFLVLHKGEILTEVYLNSMTPHSQHIFFSMSKSLIGDLAGILEARGQLDPEALVTKYVPEMKGGAYGDATVRQVMDMTIGMKFNEDYDDFSSDVYVYSRASNSSPNPDKLTIYEVLPKFEKQGEHGERFHYITANTDALGWIVQRASGRHLVELLSTEIWSKLGVERDAYAISDLNRTPFMGGGFNATLRDAARFGLMMQRNGHLNGHQIVPKSFIRDIQENAFATRYPGTSYRSQWWVHPDQRSFRAIGVAGQNIIIVPQEELVIVKLSSWPALSGYHPEGRAYDARAIDAVIDYVKKQ
jgi:hypothetical protein